MKKGDVIGGGLVPANQNAPEAVQPAVSAFHHPAAGFEAGFLFDGLRLFSPAPDVGCEAKLLQGSTNLIKVLALIQAHTPGTLRTRDRARHGETIRRSPHQLHVMAVGPLHRQPHRDALGFGQQTAFDPALTPVRGVGAGFSPPPKGALVMAPSMLSQLQSMPCNSSYCSSPFRHSSRNTPAAARS